MARKQSSDQSQRLATLRERALAVPPTTRTDVSAMAAEEAQRLVQELQIHQRDLEMQSQELREAQVELAESRDRYADLYQEIRRLVTLIETAHDAIYTRNLDGTITSWNRGAERMYGYTAHEAIGQSYLILVPNDCRNGLDEKHARLLRGESVAPFETRRLRKDGALIFVSAAISPITDGTGQVVGFASIGRDIGERRRAEAALRKSEERFRVMADHAPVFIWMSGTDKRCTWLNKSWLDFSGRTMEDQLGDGWVQGLHAEDLDRCFETYRSHFEARSSFTMEFRMRRYDGVYRWILSTGIPWLGPGGEFSGYIGSGIDINDRKRAEEELRAVLDTATDAIINIDHHGVITDVNLATERMFGYARDELIGQNVKILMPPPYRDEHDGYIERYLQTGVARIIGIGREAVGRRKDGSTFPVDLAVSQVDHLGLFTGIIRNISERKELQQHVLEIVNEEHQRIGQELHDGTGQELTGLSLFAGSLLKILRSATQASATGKAIYQLEEADFLRLQQIASRLSQGLTLANRHVHELSHGIMPVQIDAEGLRSALVELAATISDQENITCRAECSGPVRVANNATATHLYRIAQESLHNALLHGRAKQIQISLSQQGEQIVLEVRDNGVGIDQTAGRGASAPGKGMGLRIMDYRAAMIGGLFRVERNQPNGTLVRCTAPLGGGG